MVLRSANVTQFDLFLYRQKKIIVAMHSFDAVVSRAEMVVA